jgi:predicted MPP superfamily phosphohydrolase
MDPLWSARAGCTKVAARAVGAAGCQTERVPSTAATAAGLVGGVVGLGAATVAYALWEARQYTLRRFEIGLDRAGTGGDRPLRVLHLSDLHLSPRDSDRIAWVRDLATLAPDLTVVTGDFHGDPDGPRLALRALEPLLTRPGLYVRGSNDYFAPRRTNPAKYLAGPSEVRPKRPQIDVAPLNRGLTEAGWFDLDNARADLRVGGWDIDARGVDDPHIRRDRYEQVAGPFRPEADLRLGVTHAPYRRVLDPMAADGADLVLAGHTHGGQLCVPWVGALVTNCDLPRAQAKGVSRWGSAHLHVCAGLGTSPYTPIRIACRPEATLLTISR